MFLREVHSLAKLKLAAKDFGWHCQGKQEYFIEARIPTEAVTDFAQVLTWQGARKLRGNSLYSVALTVPKKSLQSLFKSNNRETHPDRRGAETGPVSGGRMARNERPCGGVVEAMTAKTREKSGACRAGGATESGSTGGWR